MTGLWVGVLLACAMAAWLPRSGAAAAIAVVNQSSVTSASDTAFSAAIRAARYGPELVVSGPVGERTSTGERLFEAFLQVIVLRADGTPLWVAEAGQRLTPGDHLDFRVGVKPFGVLDGALVSQVILRDLKVDTIERQAREAQRRAEEERVAKETRVKEARAAEQARAAEARAAIEAERQATMKREREREASIRARGWPPNIERAVIERTVVPGMTAAQVSMAWGPPRNVNETIQASGVSEQWVYSLDRYVYFRNGRVTAIQKSR